MINAENSTILKREKYFPLKENGTNSEQTLNKLENYGDGVRRFEKRNIVETIKLRKRHKVKKKEMKYRGEISLS